MPLAEAALEVKVKGRETLENLATMDPTDSMNPGKRKRIKKAKRKVVGYDPTPPMMCSNCRHFKNDLHAGGEYFPPRCEKYKFQVDKQAVCDHWEDVPSSGRGRWDK